MSKHLISNYSASLTYLNGHSNKMSLFHVIGMHNAACIGFPQTVIDILEVLDTIQAWPDDVVEDMGPE